MYSKIDLGKICSTVREITFSVADYPIPQPGYAKPNGNSPTYYFSHYPPPLKIMKLKKNGPKGAGSRIPRLPRKCR